MPLHKTPHGPAVACGRFVSTIETKTRLADMIFWVAVTLPVVIFATGLSHFGSFELDQQREQVAVAPARAFEFAAHRAF